MDKDLKKLINELNDALHSYFNASADPQGRSDKDAVVDIVSHILTKFRWQATLDEEDDQTIEQKIGVVDTEDGLNVAYDFASHLDGGMLDSLDPLIRIELLEACIYALNSRINDLEVEIKKRINERRQGQ